jgi:predicted nucleotide-binding protein (sugar kinase/HSP70/actin superfamily)
MSDSLDINVATVSVANRFKKEDCRERKSLPVVNGRSIERPEERRHYERLREASGEPMLAKSRIYLFPEPSNAQGVLLEHFMRQEGVNLRPLPTDDEESLSLGKRYTNRGQCAPVVYVTGSLVKYLLELRRNGMSDEEIQQKYGFITVQPITCTCRRGAFEEEFRKAVHSLGLDKFVLEFIDIGLPKPSVSGLKIDIKFYRRVFLAILLGDILNDIQRRIRPYEKQPGLTDEVLNKVLNLVGESYRDASDKNLCLALLKSRKLFEAIPVDFAQLKPKVRIIGEYQVAATEGHCTGDMFRWLESQGAEVALWQVAIFMLHKVWYRTWRTDREFWAKKKRSLKDWKTYLRAAFFSRLTYWSLERLHRKYSKLLGRYAYPLPDMKKMMNRTDSLYHRAFVCSAAFTELAQHIAAFRDGEADMVLSLKSFGCLPSACSDAIQSKVELQEAQSVFLALEMSGDAIANCRSRIQMKMAEARKNVESKLMTVAVRRATNPEAILKEIRELNLGVNALSIRTRIPGCTVLAIAEEHLS